MMKNAGILEIRDWWGLSLDSPTEANLKNLQPIVPQ